MTDREQVWEQMAKEHPTFLPEYDIANNHHAVREIVLGGSVTWAGVWQRFKPQAGMKVMDIGANAGIFSIHCALHGADVTAYEPHRDICIGLARLISKHHFSIQLIHAAIWRETGAGIFLGHESPLEEFSFRFNGSLPSDGIVWTEEDKNKAASVLCRSLDEAIGTETFDMVKLDIEGAECEVLLAASLDTLRRIKFMYVEFHPWVSEKLYKETLSRLEAVYRFEGAYWNSDIGRWEAAYLSL